MTCDRCGDEGSSVCELVFYCYACDSWISGCSGHDDDEPDMCDECWSSQHPEVEDG